MKGKKGECKRVCEGRHLKEKGDRKREKGNEGKMKENERTDSDKRVKGEKRGI